MADDVAITAGSGTTIGADNISSVFYQRNKLIHGVDGTNDGDVSTLNPLPIRNVAAQVDGDLAGVSGSYVTGDTGGTLVTVALGVSTGQFITILSAHMMDGNVQMAPFDLYFYSATITLAADSAADAISDADNLLQIGYLSFPGVTSGTNNRQARCITGLPMDLICGTSGNIFMKTVMRSTVGTISGATVRMRFVVRR